jgi:tripartite ATP-independent transporter DctP family solute receptor
MKKRIALVLALAMLLLVLTACGGKSSAPAAAAAQTFSVALTGSETHQYTLAMRMLDEILQSKTDGRIKLEIFANSALGGEREAVEGVIMGSIDMTMVTIDGVVPAWVKDAGVMSIPYLFTSREEVYNALDNYLKDRLDPQYIAVGLKNLGFGELGFRHFTNNKRPVKTASDMKGLLIRVQESPVWFGLCESLGATAQPISFNELYTALQQGVVDGQENPFGTIASMKYYEVQKYMVLDGHTYAGGNVFMGLKKWESLSAEDKAIFQSAVDEMIPKQRQLIKEMDEENKQELLKGGMTIEENPDLESFAKATMGLENREAIKVMFDDISIVQGVRDFLK